MQDTESEMDLESWREVHKALTESVIVGKEAVAAAKAQRRYWLEEIVASLGPEGKLTPNAVWKKATKKGGPKRKTTKAVSKRKKSDDTETEDEATSAKKAKVARKNKKAGPKKIKLKLKGPKAAKAPKATIPVEEDEDVSMAQASAYSSNEQEAAAALQAVASTNSDMSHIPDVLRAFMAPQEYAIAAPDPPTAQMTNQINPYAAKGLHPFIEDDDDDDDDDEEENDDDEEDDDDDDDDEDQGRFDD
jgi:hypothetical protein